MRPASESNRGKAVESRRCLLRRAHQMGVSIRTLVWSCRLFYFTNYDHVQGDMENTFDFILNRFFSTRLFVHLRYDDARALNKDFGHFQLKELLSFGFNYKF